MTAEERKWRQHYAKRVMQGLRDLNRAVIDVDGTGYGYISTIAHRQQPVVSNNVTAVFANHETILADEIRRWPVVLGCVAWLTNEVILRALQGREVSLIVQKEDWLRPDSGNYSYDNLRTLYAQLKPVDRVNIGTGLSINTGDEMDPVMCCGIINAEKKMATARMHHKFFVFGDWHEECVGVYEGEEEYTSVFKPQGVWTGSFNPTFNATQSLENALLIRDPALAEFFFQEWTTVLALAEPLDWTAEWVEPIYRIGT